jgi:LPXTG-motif cell wall-anchored protein
VVTVGKIFNRRNAVIGFVVLKLRKREAKKKVAAAVPDAQTAGIAAATLAALAGLAGGLVFWRKRRAATE